MNHLGEARSLVAKQRNAEHYRVLLPGMYEEVAKDPVAFDYLITQLPLNSLYDLITSARGTAFDPADWNPYYHVPLPTSVLCRRVTVDASQEALYLELAKGLLEARLFPKLDPRRNRLLVSFDVDDYFRCEYARLVREAWTTDQLTVEFPKRRSQL